MAFIRYGDVWRKVRLSIPGADPFLARSWVDDAYRELGDYRGWNWLTYQDQLVWQDPRDVAVTVTAGSTLVTSAALFLAADAGRQFKIGTSPIYTVQTFIDANNIELDLAWAGADTGAQTATIYDGYATLPQKFGAFRVILDYVNQRFVPWWMTQDELGLLDPARSSTNSGPCLLVARGVSTFPATLGQVQYEYWPQPSAAGAYPYYATARPAPPADDALLQGVLGDRPDILETGALAKACRWPGTATYKNPYFNMTNAQAFDNDFKRLCLQLDLRDDDQSQQSIQTIPWHKWNGWAWAYDTHLLRATDATLGDYFGGGGYFAASYWP